MSHDTFLRGEVMKPLALQRCVLPAAFLCTAVLSFSPFSARAALNDTGQTLCYDSAALIAVACDDAHVGDAGPDPRQGARFGRDAAQVAGALTKAGGGGAGFDFSRVCNDGSDCSVQVTTGVNAGEWGCTRDNVTGLTWEMKTMTGGSPRDQFRAYTWYDSTIVDLVERGVPGNTATCNDTLGGANCNTENYVNSMNAAGLCGHGDWRIPTRRELLSIANYGRVGGAIDPDYFPNTNVLDATGFYWTAESDVIAPGRAWYIHFQYGNSVPATKAGTTMGVRLVRGALPAATFQDNGNGTVSDAATGLTWDQCALGQRPAVGIGCTAVANATSFTWRQALVAAVAANAQNYLGYNDWRLPNAKELESLIAIGSAVYIDQVFFPQTPASPFWSSTTSVAPPLNGWYVDFGHGNVSYDVYSSSNKMVRLVRGGQAFDLLLPATTTLAQTAASATAASFSATLVGMPVGLGTGYWVVRAATDPAPTPAELMAGAPAGAPGNGATAAGQTQVFSATGLTLGPQYVVYYAARFGTNLTLIHKLAFTAGSGPPTSPASIPTLNGAGLAALALALGALVARRQGARGRRRG